MSFLRFLHFKKHFLEPIGDNKESLWINAHQPPEFTNKQLTWAKERLHAKSALSIADTITTWTTKI